MFYKLKTKIIATLGPATRSEADLRKIKSMGVDLVRINMSHSSDEDLKYFLDLSRKIGLEFVIDTEGSQIRTGVLSSGKINLIENDLVKIYNHERLGNEQGFNLKPCSAVAQLDPGDLIYIDFDAVILRVSDISTIKDGYIIAKVASQGSLGSNKAVVVHSGLGRKFILPALSLKDYRSIELGLSYGANYLAVSFARNRQAVEEARTASCGKMKIISKIECVEALENLEQIIEASDFLLIDRGDLSKEIPLERVPFAQKIVIERASAKNVGVFVATNLLESMIENKKPTRAEVHDIIQTVADGAYGLVLSAETAVGKNPIESINIIKKIVGQAEQMVDHKLRPTENWQIKNIIELPKLADKDFFPSLIEPHGGRLVNRLMIKIPNQEYLNSLPRIILDKEREMDIEQIAIGTFSPVDGFMKQNDFQSVLNNWRLADGTVWPLPIIFDVSQSKADELEIGHPVLLANQDGEDIAILHLEEKYHYDKKDAALKLYGTESLLHPGAAALNKMRPVLLGGKIDLFRRRQSEFKEYELTPAQIRGLFEERGWVKVVGFHTRNVIHRSHEFIQMNALENEYCDGLFVHPVIGKKKAGDFNAKYIISSYEKMIKDFYPKNKVVFSVFSTFSRYAGPREAIFTALCRKNFGCSHFIIGRDHTGVGDFYHPYASHEIFDRFDDLGIAPVRFENIFYSKKLNKHLHEKEISGHEEEDKLHISGTQARKIFEDGNVPPSWFMRPEISEMISNAIKCGEEVFVKPESKIGQVVWLTGLSGSGKSSLAEGLRAILESEGKNAVIIDGDDARKNLNKHLGFGREDIRENNRLIAELAKTKIQEGEVDFVLIPVIAPYKEDRAASHCIIGSGYHEVFVDCPLEKCVERDVKGLYKKAFAGEIDNFIGISPSNPYETPDNPDLVVKIGDFEINRALEEIIRYFKNKSLL